MGQVCLSREELAELTGKVQAGAQRRVLEALGIDVRTRPDGSLVVFRYQTEAPSTARARGARACEPDFDALDAALDRRRAG